MKALKGNRSRSLIEYTARDGEVILYRKRVRTERKGSRRHREVARADSETACKRGRAGVARVQLETGDGASEGGVDGGILGGGSVEDGDVRRGGTDIGRPVGAFAPVIGRSPAVPGVGGGVCAER